MPKTFLEAPTGIRDDAKQRLVEKLTAALDEAYHDPDNDYSIFFREYPSENVGQNGRLRTEPVRPVYFIEGPPLPRIDARKKLVAQLNAALAEAYQGIANTREIMILINEHPLENVGAGGRLTSEDPAIVEATAARGLDR
jgi:phenylpyruvate tautomerase PptA (4-oxalocrotonate tautomerase family)